MTTHTMDPDVIESQVSAGLSLVGDAEIDTQVATARRFPRSLTRFMQKAQEMATLTPEIAASCIYALPRKENGKQKNIEGPSARLAEICASAWGNLRAEGKVLGHDDEYVTSRGTAWDVENNVAIAYEVKRRITTSDGRKFSADMIGVTGNASASIALRNAILKVIPTPFWKPIYIACRQVVAGDVKTFASRRDAMLHEFGVMGVTEERLYAVFGLKGKEDITLDHIATLRGFYTALRDGDTTIEEAFPEGGGMPAPQPAQRKSQQPPAPVAAAPPVAAPAPAPSAADPWTGTVIDVIEKIGGTLIKLSTGKQCVTRDESMVRAAHSLKASGTRAEFVTKVQADPKFAPTIEEINPLVEGTTA